MGSPGPETDVVSRVELGTAMSLGVARLGLEL